MRFAPVVLIADVVTGGVAEPETEVDAIKHHGAEVPSKQVGPEGVPAPPPERISPVCA